MILKIDDWEFDIDMERTMEYSASEAADHCDCAYCRNFYAAVDIAYPELPHFLAQFGLNVEAPDVLFPYDIEEWMLYEGEYAVFGRILQYGKDRINVGNAYIHPTVEYDLEMAEPHFVLSVEELEIPWILDESLKDVVSPANDPAFIDQMKDRLLQIQADTLLS